MIRYVFRQDEPLIIKAAKKANPQKIGEFLAKLTAENKGRLDPDAVWRAVKADPKNPLYKHYEWDIEKAAEAHWRDTSRAIIRVIRVADDDAAEGTTRAFLSINDGGGRAFYPVDEVKRSIDLQAALSAQADRELEAFQRRFRSLKEVCAIIELAREKLRVKAAKDASATRGNGRSKRPANNETHASA